MFALVGWLAVVIGVARMVPQAVVVLRGRAVSGVSVVAPTILAAGCVLWIGWSLSVGNVPSLIASAAGAVPPMVVVYAVSRSTRRVAPLVFALLAVLGGLVLGFVAPVAASWAGVVLAMSLSTPQVVRIARSGDVSGVSAATWAITGANSALWLINGIGLRQWQLAAPAAVTIPGALVIVLRVRVARRLDARLEATP